MRRILEPSFVTSPPSDGVSFWSKSPESLAIKDHRGEVFSVISVDSEQKVTLWKTVFEEAYFSTLSGSGLEVLKTAVESANTAVKTPVDVAVAVLWGEVIYVAFSGKAWAGLIRDGKYFTLGGGTNGRPTVVSGFLRLGDLLTLEVGNFSNISYEERLRVFSNQDWGGLAGSVGILSLSQTEVPAEEEQIHLAVEPSVDVQTIKNPIYLGPHPKINPKKFMAIGIVAAVGILGLFLFTQIKDRLVNQQEKTAVETVAAAEKKEKAAVELLGLNDVLAKQGLLEARKQLEPLRDRSDAKKVIERIENEVNLANKIRVVDSAKEFYRPVLLKDKAVANSGVLVDSKLYILDGQNGFVFKVDTKTKAGTVLTTSDKIIGGVGLAVLKTTPYILTPKGVMVGSRVVVSPDGWAKASEIDSYNGNLYVLDGQAGQIWRYSQTGDGFSKPKGYFPKNISPIGTFFVNGSVYVSVENEVKRYTAGEPDGFKLTGFDQDFEKIGSIFVDSKENIYVWDQAKHILAVFDAKGQYVSRYVFAAENPRQIIVNEAGNEVLLISDAIIKSFVLE